MKKLFVLFHVILFSNIMAQNIHPPWEGSWEISSDYGPRTYATSRWHHGIDYKHPAGPEVMFGQYIYPIESGTISALGWQTGNWRYRISSGSYQWKYYHLFTGTEENPDPIIVNDTWELRNNAMHYNGNGEIQEATCVIIKWIDISENKAEIIYSKDPNSRIKNSDGSYILNESGGAPITTTNQALAGVPIGPVGNSGMANPPSHADSHLHVGLLEDQNRIPLTRLYHSPDVSIPPPNIVLPMGYISNGDLNDLKIEVRVFSANALDVNKVDIWLWKNGDPNQAIHLPTGLSSNQASFNYGGLYGESKLNMDIKLDGSETGVRPNGTPPGDDSFFLYVDISNQNLDPNETHKVVAKVIDINGNESAWAEKSFTIGEKNIFCFLIDRSYSMHGEALKEAKAYAGLGVNMLDEYDWLSIIAFSYGDGELGVETVYGHSLLDNPVQALAGIGQIETEDTLHFGTSIGAALLQGVATTATASDQYLHFTLFSDGYDVTPPSGISVVSSLYSNPNVI